MIVTGFLFDENMPHRAIRKLLQARDNSIQCWVVGEHGAPAIGTPAPELLAWIEGNNCIVVTRNHASMPSHLRDHLASGGHVPGIIVMKPRLAPWQMAEELLLIWGASFPASIGIRSLSGRGVEPASQGLQVQ